MMERGKVDLGTDDLQNKDRQRKSGVGIIHSATRFGLLGITRGHYRNIVSTML